MPIGAPETAGADKPVERRGEIERPHDHRRVPPPLPEMDRLMSPQFGAVEPLADKDEEEPRDAGGEIVMEPGQSFGHDEDRALEEEERRPEEEVERKEDEEVGQVGHTHLGGGVTSRSPHLSTSGRRRPPSPPAGRPVRAPRRGAVRPSPALSAGKDRAAS